MVADTLSVYTIYDHPSDYPDCFVCRRSEPHGQPVAHVVAKEVVGVGDTLEQCRETLPEGLFMIPRQPNDDPVIVECWV